jgi:hypothetical protein
LYAHFSPARTSLLLAASPFEKPTLSDFPPAQASLSRHIYEKYMTRFQFDYR